MKQYFTKIKSIRPKRRNRAAEMPTEMISDGRINEDPSPFGI